MIESEWWYAEMEALERRLEALVQREAYVEELRQAWHVEWQVFQEEYHSHQVRGRAMGLVDDELL